MTTQTQTKPVVTLPDGYNGSTEVFFTEPLERDGTCVKLQCAAPGKQHLIAWRSAAEFTAAIEAQAIAAQVEPASAFGLAAALPAAFCVGYLAYTAFALHQPALGGLFTLVGAAVAYGGSRIN